MEQTIELMRKRHAYFSSLIKEHNIKTARQFYDDLYEWFEILGIELSLNEEKTQCGIYLALDYTDYEEYTIIEGEDGLPKVSPDVWWNDNYCSNSTVNIFEEDRL